jgi:hypothetical protein
MLFTVRRVHSQVDGDVGNSLVPSGDTIGLAFDLQSNIVKVDELLSFQMKKLGVF